MNWEDLLLSITYAKNRRRGNGNNNGDDGPQGIGKDFLYRPDSLHKLKQQNRSLYFWFLSGLENHFKQS